MRHSDNFLTRCRKRWYRHIYVAGGILALASILIAVSSWQQRRMQISIDRLKNLNLKGVAVEVDHRYRGTLAWRIYKSNGESELVWSSPHGNTRMFNYIRTGDTVEIRGAMNLVVISGIRDGMLKSDTFELFISQ